MTKEEKIFSRNKSPHIPTTNTYLPSFGSNLQPQFEELHMVDSHKPPKMSPHPAGLRWSPWVHMDLSLPVTSQWVSSLTNDSRNFLREDPESSPFTKGGTRSGKAVFTDLRREEATAASKCPYANFYTAKLKARLLLIIMLLIWPSQNDSLA